LAESYLLYVIQKNLNVKLSKRLGGQACGQPAKSLGVHGPPKPPLEPALVVCRFSCRYTLYQTENSNHLDQNSIIWHKCSILVNDNTAEYNVSQEKKNYCETIYDGAISIKETF